MSNDLIVIDNSIVTSAYKLSMNELRLIYCALMKIPKSKKGEPIEPIDHRTQFYITRDDFIEIGANSAHVARDIRQATKDLLKRTVIIPTNNGDLEFNWLHSVLRYDANAEKNLKEKYPNDIDHERHINTLRLHNFYDQVMPHKDDDNIIVRLRFHEDIIPLLSGLQVNFTKLFIKEIKQFNSMYSHRIYQLMMQYKSTGYVKISLDKLKFMLVLNGKYDANKDLRRRVIDVAVKEINEKSPYKVDYVLTKKGRKFTHLELKFKKNEDEKVTVDKRDKSTADMFNGLTDSQLERVTRSQKFVSDYGYLVHSASPANRSMKNWTLEMVKKIKEDPRKFTKKPMQEYLDDEPAKNF